MLLASIVIQANDRLIKDPLKDKLISIRLLGSSEFPNEVVFIGKELTHGISRTVSFYPSLSWIMTVELNLILGFLSSNVSKKWS